MKGSPTKKSHQKRSAERSRVGRVGKEKKRGGLHGNMGTWQVVGGGEGGSRMIVLGAEKNKEETKGSPRRVRPKWRESP